ncbi:hypothetical protein CP8484711_1881A, partial [Chlamydia psittaci 84-8471/1]
MALINFTDNSLQRPRSSSNRASEHI